MSSVRIESDAFGDDRYERLAREAGLSDADHARGKMLRLWRQCTIEMTYELSEQDVIQVLGARGVDALVAARLGDRTRTGVRIRGTKGRIEWLTKLRKNGRKGGRPAKTKRKPSGFQELNPLALALALAPSLTHTENTPLTPQGGAPGSGRKSRPRKRAGPTEQERGDALEVLRVLSLHSGVDYRGSDAHVDLITRQFRKGRTLLDLRKVCWHCAINLDWKNKPEMQRYLRPETLFGPNSIEKYFDSALTAYRKEFGTDEDLKPKLAVVPGERETA